MCIFVQLCLSRLYNGAMLRARKGFTLVELIVTIGIIALGSAMAISIIASLVSIQEVTAKQNKMNDDIYSVNSICSDYVSFVSITNDDFDFTFESSSANNVTFVYSTYHFNLTYISSSNTLSIGSDYDGNLDYLLFSESVSLSSVKNISFSFNDEIGLLCADVSFKNITNHLSYVIKV